MEKPGWRLLLSSDGDGPYNMAVDEVLMESVREGGAPTLRLYTWSVPTLSLGRHQPGRGLYPVGELTAAGVGIVRRQTGGRAVLHHHELTYSVVAPDRFFGSARRAYIAINTALAGAIRELGVEAGMFLSEDVGSPGLSDKPCFAEPAHGEVVAAGRKLIGSAQLRLANVLLQHGSIPLRRSELLDTLSATAAASLDGSAAYLDLAAGRQVKAAMLSEMITRCWASCIGSLSAGELTGAEQERVTAATGRFQNEDWTWRR